MSKLCGVIPPIATPLLADGRIDDAGLRRLTRYLVDAGVHGMLANGTMGGFAFLADEDQVRAVATVADAAAGAVPVMAGLGETSTLRAVRKARAFAREGVSCLSVLPPFYFFATQEHLVAYFSEIAAAVDLPVYLYDNPVLTKNHIHPETVARLRETVPNIVGIKESNQDAVNLQRLIDLNGSADFSILTGSEFLIVVGLQMGCDGCIGGLHNVCPQIAVALYEAFRRGDLETARAKQRELASAWEIFRYGSLWGAFDTALRYLELADSATGAPYRTAVSADDTAAIHAILDRFVKPYLRVPVRPATAG